MASLVTYGNGLRRIEFALVPNERRKVIRLGRVTAKAAQSFKARIEAVIADKLQNRTHDAETAKWLGGLDETMLAKLRAVGLADGVGLARTTLGVFLARYFETMSVKPSTRTFYGHTRRNLEAYFGKVRTLGSITPADADTWRAWLVENEGLSPATVARRVIAARTIWRKALRWKLTIENPFGGVRGGHQMNESRKRFIPREDIDLVLAEAPDAEWRAIIVLARYGGLRTPSETFALRWGDINWERGTMHVTCPKLAHHEQHASRIIPLFPELREPLLTLFDEAEPGTEYVIAGYRQGGANLRTQFERIITRAGLKPWPRLFHNLRASRETELMREYDLATVCRWIGNSPAVAAQHYATSIDLDSDFRRAASLPSAEAQQKAQQPASDSDEQGKPTEPAKAQNTLENPGNVAGRQLCTIGSTMKDWAQQDSNLRPTDYESAALTN
jgi:integrase